MRRLVSMLCVLALSACGGGGGGRSALPPAGADGASSGVPTGTSGTGQPTGRLNGILVSPRSIAFTATGWEATQVVRTTWRDDSRKTAVSSDPLVVTVSPPYQLAQFLSPNAFGATYYVTPVGPGKATITFSDHDGAESATLTVTVTALPNETLYVGATGEVDAFPAAADGATLPQRRIKGFYQPFVPGSRKPGGAGPIGTLADGTLDVLRNYLVNQSGECDVLAYSATANGLSGWLGTFPCSGSKGYGVGQGLGGEIDVMVSAYSGGGPVVKRFVNGSLQSSLTVVGNRPSFNGLATDASGNIFVSTQQAAATVTGQIVEYAAGAADGGAPLRTIAAPSNGYFGPVAVARDGTIYAAFVIPDYTTGGATTQVYAYAPGATSPSRRVGPPGSDTVVALACDHAGELYVALDAFGQPGSRVDVYAANAHRTSTPLRSIPNPIPADAAGGSGIVSMTLGPPQPLPPQEVLGRFRQR